VARLADNIRHAQLEQLTEKERHEGLSGEEKRRLLELLKASAGPSRT
jgi:DNA primase